MVDLIDVVQQQSFEVALGIEDAEDGLGLNDVLVDELPDQRFPADPVLIDATDVLPAA